MACSMPSSSQVSTASAMGSSSASSTRAPRAGKASSTKSLSSSSSGGHRADADPEPGVVLAAEGALDALEAVVAAGGAGAAQPEAAEGQRHFVHQDQQVAAGIEVGEGEQRRERGAAPVHVGLRLERRGPGARSSCLRPPGRGRRGAAGPAASARPGGRPGETRRCAGSRRTPGRDCPAPRWRAALRLSAWSRASPSPSASAFGFRMSSGSAARDLLDGRGGLLGPRRHDGADRRVGIVEDPGLRDA